MDDLTTRERSDLRSLVQASAEHERRRSARRGRWVAGGVSVLTVAAIATGATLAALAPRVDTANEVAAEVVGTWVSDEFDGLRLDVLSDGTYLGNDICGPTQGDWSTAPNSTVKFETAEDQSECAPPQALSLRAEMAFSLDEKMSGTVLENTLSLDSEDFELHRVADDRSAANAMVGTWSDGESDQVIALRADGSFRYSAGCSGTTSGEWRALADGGVVLETSDGIAEGFFCLRAIFRIVKLAFDGDDLYGFRGSWIGPDGSRGDYTTTLLTRSSSDPDAIVGEWQSAPDNDARLMFNRDGGVTASGPLCGPEPTEWRGRWMIAGGDQAILDFTIDEGCESIPGGTTSWLAPFSEDAASLAFRDPNTGENRTFERVTP